VPCLPDLRRTRRGRGLRPHELIVRDVFLGDESAEALRQAQDRPALQRVKWEATIRSHHLGGGAAPDRAGAGRRVFTDFEMVYSILREGRRRAPGDGNRGHAAPGGRLPGRLGSRGGGKIAFRNVNVSPGRARLRHGRAVEDRCGRVEAILKSKDALVEWVKQAIPIA